MLIESGPVCLTLPRMLYQRVARAQSDAAILAEHTDQELLEQAPPPGTIVDLERILRNFSEWEE